MSRLFLSALLAAFLLGPNASATEQNPRALPDVRVADTDPPAGRNLSRNWPLYIHLRYESEAPLRVQVKGFFQGIEVTDGVSWNPSPAYPVGTGEAIAWIAFTKPTHLDELRVEVSDAGWNDLLEVKVPMNVAWTALASQRPARAEWVPRLSDAQQKVTRDDMAKIGNNPLGYLLGTLTMLSVPGYLYCRSSLGSHCRAAGGSWRSFRWLSCCQRWDTRPSRSRPARTSGRSSSSSWRRSAASISSSPPSSATSYARG